MGLGNGPTNTSPTKSNRCAALHNLLNGAV
jgi:hypothetical protein